MANTKLLKVGEKVSYRITTRWGVIDSGGTITEVQDGGLGFGKGRGVFYVVTEADGRVLKVRPKQVVSVDVVIAGK